MSNLCLDLCSGLGGFSQAFVDAGWEVIRIDDDWHFSAKDPYTYMGDATNLDFILTLLKRRRPDVFLASPPCECFSVASIGTHWKGGKNAYEPADVKTWKAIKTVQDIDGIRKFLGSKFWLIENPRGVLRKLNLIEGERHTVCLCQYGDDRMKPTDLWGNVPMEYKMCHNGAKDHQEARRGAKTGTQGRNGSAERAKLPYGLSKAILEAVSEK